MKCDDLKEMLSEYIDGELAGVEVAAVEAHVAKCDGCRAELAELRRTAELVRSLPRAEAPARLGRHVAATVERQVMARRRSMFLRWSHVGGLVAAAAALVIVIQLAPWDGIPERPAAVDSVERLKDAEAPEHLAEAEGPEHVAKDDVAAHDLAKRGMGGAKESYAKAEAEEALPGKAGRESLTEKAAAKPGAPAPADIVAARSRDTGDEDAARRDALARKAAGDKAAERRVRGKVAPGAFAVTTQTKEGGAPRAESKKGGPPGVETAAQHLAEDRAEGTAPAGRPPRVVSFAYECTDAEKGRASVLAALKSAEADVVAPEKEDAEGDAKDAVTADVRLDKLPALIVKLKLAGLKPRTHAAKNGAPVAADAVDAGDAAHAARAAAKAAPNELERKQVEQPRELEAAMDHQAEGFRAARGAPRAGVGATQQTLGVQAPADEADAGGQEAEPPPIRIRIILRVKPAE